MITAVRGSVSKLPYDAAKGFVNQAWKDIRRQNLWSFLLYDRYQWIAPPMVSAGTATTVQGTDTVVVDATAAAAIDAASTSYSLITQRQFRIAAGTIYNIWGWDSGTRTLTLDRPYGEASITGAAYQIYQCYYAAPYKDHLLWISVRDMQNFLDLFLEKTRSQIDAADPQRTWYYFPTDVVFYQLDLNPDSTTYRFPMYELWGAPTYTLNYQLYGIRRGVDMTSNTDELPPAVGEDCVIALGKYYAYEWAEAHKNELSANGTVPDFKFLMGKTYKDYERLFKEYRRQDRETVNNWFTVRRVSLYGKYFSYFNSIGGTAYPGVSMGG